MSFIYAEKVENGLNILCDTKIQLNEIAEATISREQRNLIFQYGVVKTTIICPEISISFAGNIFCAAELFRRLYKKHSFNTKDVVDMAFTIHQEGNNQEIDFIIASCDDGKLKLHCIKDGTIEYDCQVAHLGSQKAFEKFQEYRLNHNVGSASERTQTAFLNCIQSNVDDTVGKFAIVAGFEPHLKSIRYCNRTVFQEEKMQRVELGKPIVFHASAEEGGYSYRQIPVSYEEVMLDIDQMDSTILFSRSIRCTQEDKNNDQLFSLMLPVAIHQNEQGVWTRSG